MRFVPRTAAGLAVALLLAGPAWSHGTEHTPETKAEKAFDERAAIEISQGAIGRVLGAHRLRARDGRAVNLQDLRGRPLVVSFIYTSCAHTCPIVTQTLARAVEVARDALGADGARVATVGFDTLKDTPERMRIYAREQGIRAEDWLFLSADHAAIDALTKDLGFVYFRSPKGFDHVTQTTVIDKDGRVVRQIYGESFEPPSLVEPLMALSLARPIEAESLSGLFQRVRLFCSIYDPAKDRYRLDYSIVVAFAVGAACLGAVAVFLVRAWRQTRTRQNRVQGTAI